MDSIYLISQLEKNASRIGAFVEGVSLEQARWKPAPDSWSILEVINHLYDEEREDFRAHLTTILITPSSGWNPIDPPGWVVTRRYNEREPGSSLHNFLTERKGSLDWLRNLHSPDWNATHQAPWGQIMAGDILASWAAHDLLHMRQFVELHWAFLLEKGKPFDVSYAGAW